MGNDRVRLIYVLCKGRSGSTLAGLLLGAHPEIANLGEISALPKWVRNPEDRTCSCERSFLDCPEWTAVRDAYGPDWPEEVELGADDDATFARRNLRFFRTIRDVAGASVLLDKSKKLGRALRLARIPEIDLTVMHVVRDPRAVANSFRQRGVRKDRTEKLRFSYTKNAVRWAMLNALMPLRLGRHAGYVRVRYEDLVRDPRGQLQRVLGAAGLDYDPQMDHFGEVVQHGVGGNRMRLTGVREIRPDGKFLDEVGPREWAVGTALALPTLLAHGYPVRRAEAARRLQQAQRERTATDAP